MKKVLEKTHKLDGEQLEAALRDVRDTSRKVGLRVLGDGRLPWVSDVVDETLTLFLRRNDEFTCPRKPGCWAYTVARRQAVKLKMYLDALVPLVNGLEAGARKGLDLNLLDSEEPTPALKAELNERHEALLRVAGFVQEQVLALRPDQVALFQLRVREGYTCPEIAERFGVSEPALRKQWSRLVASVATGVEQCVRDDPLCSEVFAGVLDSANPFDDWLLDVLLVLARVGFRALPDFLESVFS